MRKQGALIASPIVAHKPILFHRRRQTHQGCLPQIELGLFALTELFIFGLRAGRHNRLHPSNLSFPLRFRR